MWRSRARTITAERPADAAMLAAKVNFPGGEFIVGIVVAQDNGETRGQKNRYRFHTAVMIKVADAAAASADSKSSEVTADTDINHSVARILYKIAEYNGNLVKMKQSHYNARG